MLLPNNFENEISSRFYDKKVTVLETRERIEPASGELSAETMERCFKIPRSGVPVKHLYYEDTVYPACNETMLDCTVADKLGNYCTNNGRVAFVYRDGHTYVTKGYCIVSELEHAGYSKSGLFVPISNGEQITDFGLASQWEALTKKK